MFEGIIAKAINLTLGLLARSTHWKGRRVYPEEVSRFGLEQLSRLVTGSIDRGLSFLSDEVGRSHIAALVSRSVSYAKERTPAFPISLDLPLLRGQDARVLTSPLIFLVGFVAFMGLSDHGVSAFGLWSIVLSLFAYFVGTRIAKVRFGSLPDRYFTAPILLLAMCVAGYFVFGGSAAKVGLIPLFILIFSDRHGGKVALCAFLGGYLLFRDGNMSVGFPYALLGVLGVARNLRTERLVQLLEKNAFTIASLLMAIGVLYWVLDIALVGRIPLLTSREGLDPSFTMRSHLLPIGSVLMMSLLGEWGQRTGHIGKARTMSIALVIFSAALMALLGYRTQVLITLLASILVAIAWDLITVTEVFAAGSAVVAIFAFMTIMRTYTTGANVGFLESISLRTGLTLDIYDMMAELGGYLGFTKGQTLIASISSFATLMPGMAYSPRRYIAVFAGGEGISMTSTILGPLALDFGLVGTLLILGAFGFFIQKEHEVIRATSGKRKSIMVFLYALTLGYMLIGIETGLVDYEVLILFASAFLYTIHLSRFAQS